MRTRARVYQVWLAVFSFASHDPDMSLAACPFASERRSTALNARPIAAKRRDKNLLRSPNEAARFDRIHPVLPISSTISLLRSLFLSVPFFFSIVLIIQLSIKFFIYLLCIYLQIVMILNIAEQIFTTWIVVKLSMCIRACVRSVICSDTTQRHIFTYWKSLFFSEHIAIINFIDTDKIKGKILRYFD